MNIADDRPSFSLVENVPHGSPQMSLRNSMAETLCADMKAGGRCGYRLRMWKSTSRPPSQMPYNSLRAIRKGYELHYTQPYHQSESLYCVDHCKPRSLAPRHDVYHNDRHQAHGFSISPSRCHGPQHLPTHREVPDHRRCCEKPCS